MIRRSVFDFCAPPGEKKPTLSRIHSCCCVHSSFTWSVCAYLIFVGQHTPYDMNGIYALPKQTATTCGVSFTYSISHAAAPSPSVCYLNTNTPSPYHGEKKCVYVIKIYVQQSVSCCCSAVLTIHRKAFVTIKSATCSFFAI